MSETLLGWDSNAFCVCVFICSCWDDVAFCAPDDGDKFERFDVGGPIPKYLETCLKYYGVPSDLASWVAFKGFKYQPLALTASWSSRKMLQILALLRRIFFVSFQVSNLVLISLAQFSFSPSLFFYCVGFV